MRPLHPVTGIAVTTLATLLLAALAYGTATEALRRQPTSQRPAAAPSAAPSASPALAAPPISMPGLPSPVPAAAGELVIGTEFVDALDGWVLLSGCTVVGGPPCHYSTASTTDGGTTWTRPVQVGPLFAETNGDAPRSIRFLDRLNGFVWGGEGAYLTHDGGQSWARAGFQATFVEAIAVGGGVVWAVTYPCAKGTSCANQVRSSYDGGTTWSAPRSLPASFTPDVASAFPAGLILSSYGSAGMLMTLDSGVTWRAINSPCISNPFRAEATTQDGSELWEVCTAYDSVAGAPGTQDLFVSEDGGRSWSRRGSYPQPGWWQVVSSGPRVAFTSTRTATLASHDSGLTWSPVIFEQLTFSTIRFPNGSWGWALDLGGGLWMSDDGGNTWKQEGTIPTTLG